MHRNRSPTCVPGTKPLESLLPRQQVSQKIHSRTPVWNRGTFYFVLEGQSNRDREVQSASLSHMLTKATGQLGHRRSHGLHLGASCVRAQTQLLRLPAGTQGLIQWESGLEMEVKLNLRHLGKDCGHFKGRLTFQTTCPLIPPMPERETHTERR